MLHNGLCKLGKCNFFISAFLLCIGSDRVTAEDSFKEVHSDMGALELVVSELCYEAIARQGGDSSPSGNTRLKIDKLDNGVSIKCVSEDKDKIKKLHDWAEVFSKARIK